MASQNGCLLLAVLCVTFACGVRGCTQPWTSVTNNAVKNFKDNDDCAVFQAPAGKRFKVYVRCGLINSGMFVMEGPVLSKDLMDVCGTSKTTVLYSGTDVISVYYYSREAWSCAAVMVTAIDGDDPNPVSVSEPPGACEKSAIPPRDLEALQNVKIVGGDEAIPNSHPPFAQVRYRGSRHCGGSILNETYILTAAHCVDGRSTIQFTVSVGQHDINSRFEIFREVYQVVEIIMHENYNPATTDYDIALLRLEDEIEYNIAVQPVCLPDHNDNDPSHGDMVIVVGHGSTAGGPLDPFKLLEVLVPMVDRNLCNIYYDGRITDQMICAGVKGKDSCQGDSGGPLFYVDNGTLKQYGIVSWGIGCADDKQPGVYTRVTKFGNWITG